MDLPPQRRKLPPSIGGEVSDTAIKLMQRPEFDNVPRPEWVAECVVRVVKSGNDRARSGLRGALAVSRTIPARRGLVSFLEKILGR